MKNKPDKRRLNAYTSRTQFARQVKQLCRYGCKFEEQMLAYNRTYNRINSDEKNSTRGE